MSNRRRNLDYDDRGYDTSFSQPRSYDCRRNLDYDDRGYDTSFSHARSYDYRRRNLEYGDRGYDTSFSQPMSYDYRRRNLEYGDRGYDTSFSQPMSYDYRRRNLGFKGFGDEIGDSYLNNNQRPRWSENNNQRRRWSENNNQSRRWSEAAWADDVTRESINMAEMIADPDDDGSSLCTACTLPIFSTPSISFSHGDNIVFLHHQCAHDLPRQLLHELHPHHALLLLNQLQLIPAPASAPACTNCNRICGTIFYECPYCDFRLDLVCVLQIKVLHRSHPHNMMVIRQREAASLTCSSCDSKHDPSSESESESATLSYLCNLCGYWLHPDCATLPNAIVHYVAHRHSLFLTYNLPTAAHSVCAICDSEPKRDSGVYICLNCPDYLVHMRCALTRPNSFKPVFIREAKVEDLGRFPFPDENTSLIPYIRQSGSGDNHLDQDQQRFHSHPLIFHENDDHNQSSRVCNACVQSVSPPFLSCSQCPDFFLHSCCAILPTKIAHRVHEHPLFLSPKAPKSNISAGFSCKGCELRCNGFAYSCIHCDDFSMDIACAFINPAITHEFHKNTHILFMCRDTKFGSDENCNCCSSGLSGICYECSICRNFKLHVRCALLPKTVRHVFDEHRLQLITTVNDDYEVVLCEVCEEYMETKSWYYSCSECDQSFHIDCIPAVDRLSRIKLGSTVCVDGHCCAVVLTRQDNVVCRGRRCGDCGETLKSTSDNGLAYECSKCFFGIHHSCAEKRLLRTIEITAPDN